MPRRSAAVGIRRPFAIATPGGQDHPMTLAILGHEVVGSGSRRLIVLNDWLCDTSTWDGARAYLDRTRFSWAFTDLRGYGRSRGRTGEFTLLEAAGDVLALADALGWQRFAIVSHSMSTYVAMHLGQHAPARIERIVLITPGPPRGFGADDAWLEHARAQTRDDARRAEAVRARFAERLSPGWAEYKCRRWLATSDANAAAGYISMYARDGLQTPDARIGVPVLAITGEEDALVMRSAAVSANLSAVCEQLEVAALAQCGHYPMEELPPRTVSLIEYFCGGAPVPVAP
jgi:3-oxoadipate enol-lactonase